MGDQVGGGPTRDFRHVPQDPRTRYFRRIPEKSKSHEQRNPFQRSTIQTIFAERRRENPTTASITYRGRSEGGNPSGWAAGTYDFNPPHHFPPRAHISTRFVEEGQGQGTNAGRMRRHNCGSTQAESSTTDDAKRSGGNFGRHVGAEHVEQKALSVEAIRAVSPRNHGSMSRRSAGRDRDALRDQDEEEIGSNIGKRVRRRPVGNSGEAQTRLGIFGEGFNHGKRYDHKDGCDHGARDARQVVDEARDPRKANPVDPMDDSQSVVRRGGSDEWTKIGRHQQVRGRGTLRKDENGEKGSGKRRSSGGGEAPPRTPRFFSNAFGRPKERVVYDADGYMDGSTRGTDSNRAERNIDDGVHNACSQKRGATYVGHEGRRDPRIPSSFDSIDGKAQDESGGHTPSDNAILERGRRSRRTGPDLADAGGNDRHEPPLKMKFVDTIDLEKVERIAEANGNEEERSKLHHNLRFVRELRVYEETIGPGILIPERKPRPENMSRSDFEMMIRCDNIEIAPDDGEILRWCKAFTVLQTKQIENETKEERRPIKWPEKLNTELQETTESDISLKKQTEKIEQVHEGDRAVCEDLTHSYHQVGMEPEVRNLFGIHINVDGRLYVVRVKRLPMGFVKAADIMNTIVTTLAGAATSIPEQAKDVHVDNVRMVAYNEDVLRGAQEDFRDACDFAKVTLNNDESTRIHRRGAYCGVVYNYEDDTVWLKESFLMKLRTNIENMLQWNIGEMEEAFGRLFHGAEIMAAPLWKWYSAIKFYRRRMAADEPDNRPARVWPCCMKAIHEWANYLLTNKPRKVPDATKEPEVTVFTDAAPKGWGVVVIEEATGKVHVFGGRFSRWRAEQEHINIKEARAVKESVRILYDIFPKFPAAVTWRVDNTSALGATRKGRSKIFEMNRVIAEIREQIPSSTTMKFEYVPSSLNYADAPSRGRASDMNGIATGHRRHQHHQ